uniref:Uncharacterized protein n=1 Tax=Cucumis melo TaxID=3656 RepID=A0A9I9EJB4_CUCME
MMLLEYRKPDSNHSQLSNLGNSGNQIGRILASNSSWHPTRNGIRARLLISHLSLLSLYGVNSLLNPEEEG